MRVAPFLALLLVAVAEGCQSQSDMRSDRHTMLVQSGFVPRPADTPARSAILAKLPANTFVQQSVHGQTKYLLADPSHCNCLYVGSPTAYGNYRGMLNVTQQMEEPILNPGLSPSNIDNVSGWDPM